MESTLKKFLSARRLTFAFIGLLLAGCANIPPQPEPTPPPASPFAQSQVQGPSQSQVPNDRAIADATKGMTYIGPLAPENIGILAGGQNQTDGLGSPQAYHTSHAVKAFGEQRVRHAVVRNMQVCYKVTFQKWALSEARRQAAWVQEANTATRKNINLGIAGNYVLSAGSIGTGFAVAPATPLYGVLNLFSAGQGAVNNYMWSQMVDQNDRMIALNFVLIELYFGNVDLYLQSLEGWCGVAVPFYSAHADQIVPDDGSYDYVPQQTEQPRTYESTPTKNFNGRSRRHHNG